MKSYEYRVEQRDGIVVSRNASVMGDSRACEAWEREAEAEEAQICIAEKKRLEQLSFLPQRELLYNRLLPYADELDEESALLLASVRENLGKSAMLRELKPGTAIWTARLIKYIKLYGLKFSKECHMELIKLVYELIIIPDLEPTKLHKFSTLLIMLTKRFYLISPEELTLSWRPLYEVGKRVFAKSHTTLGIYHYSSLKRQSEDDDDEDSDDRVQFIRQLLKNLEHQASNELTESSALDESLESTFTTMVQYAKVYFHESATREILDELFPRFVPTHNSTQEVVSNLALFLPVNVMPSVLNNTIFLWFENIMQLWKVCHNSPLWEPDVMILMANTAGSNIGYIDWEPYLPLMFTRFLRSFNLPVFYKQIPNNKQHNIDTSAMALWIVAVLGPKSSAQNCLDNFMTTVTTYVHSANAGRWSGKLRDILKKLPIHFVQRVQRERANYKRTWETKTPESHRLTDNDITRFVQCMLDVTLQAIFSRTGVIDISIALQQLALLKPSIVIPPIIEKLWCTSDSITEPHKMTSAMQCVVAVSRPMVSGFENGYPEGPTHVIPLLISCLPGLDPNDFKKTLVSLHCISVLCNMILLVDCSGASEYWPDLTEEEHTVCEATAQFEDFVLQYFERVFVLIESSTMEHTRMEQKEESTRSKLEAASEGALASASVAVLGQTSTKIFKLALKKFRDFVTDRTLEVNVAGHSAATLCRAFSRVNAYETFKVFIPHFCESITELLGDNEDILKEENLEKKLLFNLLMLSQVVERNGIDLMPYVPSIMKVLDKTLKLISKEGYTFSCTTLKTMIICLCNVYVEKCCSSAKDLDSSVKNFLAIREWGKPGSIWNCDLSWHVPNAEEIDCIQTIINRYLPLELDLLNNFINDDVTLSKEELNRSLGIIKSLLFANPLMPFWDNEPLDLIESDIPWDNCKITIGVVGTITMPDGSNIRKAVSQTIKKVQDKIFNSEDTRSLCKIVNIWEMLTARNNYGANFFEAHLKVFHNVKRTLEDKLAGRRGHLRTQLADRAMLQHEFRVQAISGPLNAAQADNMLALLALSTSSYSEVRIYAQGRLNCLISSYAYSFKIILPQLVKYLEADPENEHELLKGALYCLLGPKQTPIIAKHDWTAVAQLWPALIHSSPSEKPSVIKLLDAISRSINANFPTITIHLKWSDSCVESAKALVPESVLKDSKFLELLENCEEKVKSLGEQNAETHNKLMNVLLEGAESTNLHWRHSWISMCMLPAIVHLDAPYSPKAIKLIVNCLIHDSIFIRKIAIKLSVFVLKQRKQTHKKIEIESSSIIGITTEAGSRDCIPGFRPDNEWMQFDDEKVYTKEEWDNNPYNHNDSYGFYFWPKTIKMYSPIIEQPDYNLALENLDEGQREVYDFFSSKSNVDKLINYLSMEDKKGKDKFSTYRFLMFKGLFMNYGSEFLDLFIEHLDRLVSDNQESSQRCAAEIIAGIVKGTKHWSYDNMQKVQHELTPILQKVLNNMTSETFNDWGTCFAAMFEGMDVSRLGWILKIIEDSVVVECSSALLCGRLFMLQAAILQHSWRFASYSCKLLKKFQEAGMLHHPYQNVRDRMANILTSLYEMDIVYPGGSQKIAPSTEEFLKSISPQLDMLLKEGLKGASSSNNHSILPAQGLSIDEMIAQTSSNEIKNAHSNNSINLEKLKFIQESLSKSGIDKNNLNMVAIQKFVQEYKKTASTQSQISDQISTKGSDNGSNSPMEGVTTTTGFLDDNDTKSDESLAVCLEKKLSTVLDDIVADDINETESSPKQETEYEVNLRLFKTVIRWITSTVVRNPCGIKDSFYSLFPLACALGSREGDEELYHLCTSFLSILADALHDEDTLRTAINSVDQVTRLPSWGARASCLSFLQSLVFHNMALVVNDSTLLSEIRRITLQLMSDPYPEVREAAAGILAGLLHCGVLNDIPQLLEHFKALCQGEKVKKGPQRVETLARRHSGVLGLCAFIAAQPYTVPPYLPEIFSLLGRHLNDPLPIPATIRKTLGDFKRTHHDDWQNHQLKFTEDELALLSDLSVPPSYYA